MICSRASAPRDSTTVEITKKVCMTNWLSQEQALCCPLTPHKEGGPLKSFQYTAWSLFVRKRWQVWVTQSAPWLTAKGHALLSALGITLPSSNLTVTRLSLLLFSLCRKPEGTVWLPRLARLHSTGALSNTRTQNFLLCLLPQLAALWQTPTVSMIVSTSFWLTGQQGYQVHKAEF